MADVRKTIWNPEEVYPPSDDSFALVDAFHQRLKSGIHYQMVVEVGSGSGFVSAEVALTGSFILATDINPVASESTKHTLAAHGVYQTSEIIITRFWDGIRIDLFDLILFNPPYVPTPRGEMTGNGLSVSWAGGADGREVIDQFLDRVYDVLSRRNLEVLLVTIEQNRPLEIIEDAKSLGFFAEVVLKRKADEELLYVLSIRRNQ